MAAGIAAWPDIDPRSGEAAPEAPTNTLVFSRIGDNIKVMLRLVKLNSPLYIDMSVYLTRKGLDRSGRIKKPF